MIKTRSTEKWWKDPHNPKHEWYKTGDSGSVIITGGWDAKIKGK